MAQLLCHAVYNIGMTVSEARIRSRGSISSLSFKTGCKNYKVGPSRSVLDRATNRALHETMTVGRTLLAVALFGSIGCHPPLRPTRVTRPLARANGPQRPFVPITAGDFLSAEPGAETSASTGAAMLRSVCGLSRDLATFVEVHGIPDGIWTDIRFPYPSMPERVELAYLQIGKVYIVRDGVPPDERPIDDVESAYIEPTHAEKLNRPLEAAARFLTVAARMMRALPPDTAASTPGSSRGFATVAVTPLNARFLVLPPETPGIAVAWVDPAGPVAGRLQRGDRIAAVNGRPVFSPDDLWGEKAPVWRLDILREGVERIEDSTAEPWPRNVAFHIVESDVPNAFAVRGGVLVTAPMLALLESDDEIAWVVGHEVAHITQHHVNPERSIRTILTEALLAGLWVPARMAPVIGLPVQVLLKGANTRFRRDQERIADELAIRYASAAGYRPEAALTVIQRMEKEAPVGTLNSFLDSHPPYPERIAAARRVIAEVEKTAPRTL